MLLGLPSAISTRVVGNARRRFSGLERVRDRSQYFARSLDLAPITSSEDALNGGLDRSLCLDVQLSPLVCQPQQ